MCGLAGLVRQRGVSRADVDWAHESAAALRHRGPDRSDVVVSADGRAVLAHTRLSIIDLSESGNQPMASEGQCSLVAFNGEIYNFRGLRAQLERQGLSFRSESDTESVLAALDAWGPSALERLEGMFALAHYDSTAGRLLLARDPLGQKPLYVLRLADGGIAFASELNVLVGLVSERKFDPTGLDGYLRWGYAYGAESLLSGVVRLEPGTYLESSPAGDYSTRYWDVPEYGPVESDPEHLLNQLEDVLDQAVSRTLVSDVPVGVLLSGGVDSSIVAALASRRQPGIRTYSVEFPGHDVDEGEVSSAIAKRLGADHTVLHAAEVDLPRLAQTLADQDEPIGDPSILPMSVLCQAVSADCRVVLGGDGGDELFGGYVNYQHSARLQSGLMGLCARLTPPLASAGLGLSRRGMRGRYWLELLSRDPRTTEPPLGRLFLDQDVRRLLAAPAHPLPMRREAVIQKDGSRVLDGIARTDLQHYLPNDILHKVDRCSMRYSLEVRAPFLDREVVALAMQRIPTDMKVTGAQTKILLKQLRTRLLGDDMDLGRKQGFTPPLASILSKPDVREFVIGTLESAPTSTWNPTEIDNWVKALHGGRPVHWQIFALATLIQWQVRWGIEGLAAS